MKKLIIIFLTFSTLSLFSQDPIEILKKSFEKCQSVTNGHYKMNYYMEFMDGNKSPETAFICYFKKLSDDDIYSSAFHYKRYLKNGNSDDQMYTGVEYVSYWEGDSSGTIMRKSEWAKEIKSYAHNQTFYTVLTNRKSRPLPGEEEFSDSNFIFKYIGEEKINNFSCLHVQMNEIPVNDPKDDMQAIRQEYHFWVNKEDNIPVQFTIAFDMVMNNDTMYQFQRSTLETYTTDLQDIDQYVGLGSVPAFIRLSDYKPYVAPPLLPKDTIAPVWKLPDLQGDSVSLADLRGNVVLVDFFYRSCYPCMQALPALQALHEHFGDEPVKIVGIDPYDKPEDGIAEFLAKRGVTYTVLLGGGIVAKTYRISGYPTIYLIDKEGNVADTQYGFGEGVDKSLEKKIRKLLKY